MNSKANSFRCEITRGAEGAAGDFRVVGIAEAKNPVKVCGIFGFDNIPIRVF